MFFVWEGDVYKQNYYCSNIIANIAVIWLLQISRQTHSLRELEGVTAVNADFIAQDTASPVRFVWSLCFSAGHLIFHRKVCRWWFMLPPPWWRWCFEGVCDPCFARGHLFISDLNFSSFWLPCCACACWERGACRGPAPRAVRVCSGGSRWQEWCFRQMYYSPGKSWLLDLVSRCEVSIGIGKGSCNILG